MEWHLVTTVIYSDLLTLLDDLEMEMIRLQNDFGSKEEVKSYLPCTASPNAMLSCLRLEMQELFRDTVSYLPSLTNWLITVDYESYDHIRHVSIAIELQDTSISSPSDRAYVSVRALSPDPELGQLRFRLSSPSPDHDKQTSSGRRERPKPILG